MASFQDKLRSTNLPAFSSIAPEAPEGRNTDPIPLRLGSAQIRVGTVGFESGPPTEAPASLPLAGDVVGTHYKLVRLLGQGMFGKVYVAQRVDVTEHRVALKLLPRSLYTGRNVERELVMLATVGHPNVVQLKDHGTTADFVWLTMPIYEGETLAQRLERGPLGMREAYDIFIPVARGLEALHAAGLRHQDVKPENIFLAQFNRRVHPILLDLGVAAEKDAAFVAGTALYGAPEQVAVLSGAHPYAVHLSEKMDTYCAAATLLVSLVGSENFPGENAEDREALTLAHELRATSPIRPDVLKNVVGRPRELLLQMLGRCLALDPTVRPPMSDFAEELDVLLEPEREAQRVEERKRQRQKTTILRFRMASVGVVLVGLAGGAVMYSKRETLRVASELEAARKKGAESFDKLDTCIAANQMTTREKLDCQSTRERDRLEFKASLATLEQTGSTVQGESARAVKEFSNRAKACEDAATGARRTCDEDLARLSSDLTRQRAQLTMERDEAKLVGETRLSEISQLERERDQCRAERRACLDDKAPTRTARANATPPPSLAAVLGAPPSPTGGSPSSPPEPPSTPPPVEPPAQRAAVPPPTPPTPPAQMGPPADLPP